MKSVFVHMLLKILFYPAPKVKISKEEEQLFEDLYQHGVKEPGRLIEYNLSIPKYKFLYYLSSRKAILFHGSNNKQIDAFEPREQTLFNGEMTKAVFATNDPFWSMFYAVLEKGKIVGNIRNGSISANGRKMFHFYSLTKETNENDPWTSGMIYLLPVESFTHIGQGAIQFSEWISKTTVAPLAKIEVEPSDFYFINKVATHQPNESIIKSWVLYKWRIKIK